MLGTRPGGNDQMAASIAAGGAWGGEAHPTVPGGGQIATQPTNEGGSFGMLLVSEKKGHGICEPGP